MSSNPSNESPLDDIPSPESSNDMQLNQVAVNFVNITGFTNTFTISDSNNGNAVVFNGSLDDRASTGFLNLVANGNYGEAAYQYVGQSGPPTGTGLLYNQQTFEMY